MGPGRGLQFVYRPAVAGPTLFRHAKQIADRIHAHAVDGKCAIRAIRLRAECMQGLKRRTGKLEYRAPAQIDLRGLAAECRKTVKVPDCIQRQRATWPPAVVANLLGYGAKPVDDALGSVGGDFIYDTAAKAAALRIVVAAESRDTEQISRRVFY